jgi:cell division protein FtsW
MSKKLFKVDLVILGAVVGLLILGVFILTSVSAIISQENFGNSTHYLFHQILLGILPGLILAAVVYFLPIGFLKKAAWIALLINLLAMILVFIPGLGVIAGGAPRWLKIGPFSIQPSEFLKLTFIVYIAAWLSNPVREKDKSFKYTLVPFLIIIAFVAFLFTMQSDVSTLAVVMLSSFIMYFAAATPLWHTLLMILAGSSGAALLIGLSSYRLMRLKVMLGLINDPMGLGYQIKQILIGIGSGGIFGLGLGLSSQKFGFIPQTMSDSIFAIYSEETGFLGSLLLIFLFMALLIKSFQVAKKSKDKFSSLFAVGFSSWICIQAFINMGAMVGIFPLTGIPLPFLSYGGSHIIIELAGVGLLLNISKNSQK